jgi:tRNA (cytidine/uridine-2'-O-)-methyltransferase
MLHIVLYQPEIPHNTGAVGRLCLATAAKLHLIRPLGFSLEDKHLKRAGLDYWAEVQVQEWDSLSDLLDSTHPHSIIAYLTTKAQQTYWDARLTAPQRDTYLIFGPETRGLPDSLLQAHTAEALRIPMHGTRSLNLATAVGIVLYETMRQSAALHTPSSML